MKGGGLEICRHSTSRAEVEKEDNAGYCEMRSLVLISVYVM